MGTKITTADIETTQRISAAETTLDSERESLKDERKAMNRFHTRLASIDVSNSLSPTATTKLKNAIIGRSRSTDSAEQLEKVEDAYRETVMSVPHYEEDYDHSLLGDLIEEFGPDLAHRLDTADALTPPLHETLLTASQQTSERRATILDVFNDEEKSLQQARNTLEELATTVLELNQQPVTEWTTNEIIATHDRLDEFESECDQLATDRQAELHSHRIASQEVNDEGLNEYLYESLPVTYPVLADIGEFSTLLHTARQQLEQVFYRR